LVLVKGFSLVISFVHKAENIQILEWRALQCLFIFLTCTSFYFFYFLFYFFAMTLWILVNIITPELAIVIMIISLMLAMVDEMSLGIRQLDATMQ